ncbi:MAG: phosphatase PAP2 family protein [Chloroflexi bacterium]|nr:phosphatase PAP2 family protein [Chloroflexota bacterium]
MREKTQETTAHSGSRNPFYRLLAFWSEYRRFILVALIALALTSFLNSLSTETRNDLLRGLLAQRRLVTLLLLFSVVVLSLLWSAGQRLDTWIFLLFNLRGYHPLWLDRLMWVTTQIGNGFFGIVFSIFLYFSGQRRLGIQLLLGILSLWLVVELIKAIVERTRPFLVLEGARLIGWRERGLSFPSGHTAQTFFMMTFLTQHFQLSALASFILQAVAVLVGLTRIYVGAHYPRDVLGGAILGSVWGILLDLIDVYMTTGQF